MPIVFLSTSTVNELDVVELHQLCAGGKLKRHRVQLLVHVQASDIVEPTPAAHVSGVERRLKQVVKQQKERRLLRDLNGLCGVVESVVIRQLEPDDLPLKGGTVAAEAERNVNVFCTLDAHLYGVKRTDIQTRVREVDEVEASGVRRRQNHKFAVFHLEFAVSRTRNRVLVMVCAIDVRGTETVAVVIYNKLIAFLSNRKRHGREKKHA